MTKVKIKTWEAMKVEFGTDRCGDINCPLSFTAEMEEEMPKDRVINIISEEKYDYYLWDTGEGCWHISQEMIEQVLSE